MNHLVLDALRQPPLTYALQPRILDALAGVLALATQLLAAVIALHLQDSLVELDEHQTDKHPRS